jgi:hypothetical protein
MTVVEPSPMLIANARGLAKALLSKDLPERWLHTQGVANRAAELAVTVPVDDRPVLIAAAWLHDIGYAPALQETGFHPLDGALYLQGQGWDDRLVALVAHHSGARFVPVDRAFAAMMAEFDCEDGPVSDALTYADQTVGPHGRRTTVPYRVVEAITRHGLDSPNGRARFDRIPYLLAVADRVERRLKKDCTTAE